MYDNLLSGIHGAVAVLTVNRPEKLNALDRKTLAGLREAFGAVSRDETVHAAILTGAGEKAFVAGADIEELSQLSQAEGEAYSRAGQEVFDFIEHLGKPVIAAVNGYALGGGCELAMACSIRIASENAVFGQPEAGLGLIPGFGGSQRLPRMIGRGRALQMLLTGAPIDAAEAYRIGLANAVVPRAELMAAAQTMARAIAGNGAQAVAELIRTVNLGLETSLAEGQSIEAGAFGRCCDTADMKTRTRAFLDRTKK